MNVAKSYPTSKSSFKPLYDDWINYEPAHGTPVSADPNQMAHEGPVPQGAGNFSNASDTHPSIPQGLYKPSIRY